MERKKLFRDFEVCVWLATGEEKVQETHKKRKAEGGADP